ncbi:MAG: ATP-binding protein, partial [Thermoanaerobaculia bacterium]
DNGPGVPASEGPRIFDLFYSTRKGGSGLGLAIVERIVKAHGGRVTVESAPGHGALFTIALAAAPEEPEEPRPSAAGEPEEARVAVGVDL